MLKNMIGLFGFGSHFSRFRHLKGLPFLGITPFGGVVAAYLLWRNRDKLRSFYERVAHRHDFASAREAV
jgi:hypothetical protein